MDFDVVKFYREYPAQADFLRKVLEAIYRKGYEKGYEDGQHEPQAADH